MSIYSIYIGYIVQYILLMGSGKRYCRRENAEGVGGWDCLNWDLWDFWDYLDWWCDGPDLAI